MEDMGIPAYVPHKDTSHIDPTPLKIYEADMKALNKAQKQMPNSELIEACRVGILMSAGKLQEARAQITSVI